MHLYKQISIFSLATLLFFRILSNCYYYSQKNTRIKTFIPSLKNLCYKEVVMESTTPMLKQYQTIKTKHQDCILFFRLGDFYEMFYEDAKVGSQILDLVLTSRGHNASGKIPMCGIPYHAADTYITKLIKAGFKVAICEQIEDPSQAKGLVRRDVIRIITSGTFLDESSLDSRYLLCFNMNTQTVGLAFADATGGTIRANQYLRHPSKIIELIAKLPICECLFPASNEEKIKKLLIHPLIKAKNIFLSPYDDWCFNLDIARKSLCEHFKIHNLKGFGIEDLPLAQSAAGALLEYLKQMNKQPLRHIDKISLYTDNEFIFISPAACRGLELEELRKTLDHTLTPIGKRKFRFWLYHPLINQGAIVQRQMAVTLLKDHPNIQEQLKRLLHHTPDIERSISRLSCGYTHVKDILNLRIALSRLPEIKEIIEPLTQRNPLFVLEDIPDLRAFLHRMINPDVPLAHPEGKIVQKGCHPELDSLRDIQDNGRQWLKKLQSHEIKRTGINSLKIGFNKVFGYYIEVTKSNLTLVPSDYIRKQTLVNAERFITPQLKEFEEKILTAQEKILKLEAEILNDVRRKILDHASALHDFADSISTLDVLYFFSLLARAPDYIIPQIVENTDIDIKEGRHPVVEQTITESFVPNDTLLDCQDNHLMILTGPNMAGKSTYIRQCALLVIMAQIGSYIPAQSARIGIVDKIFTRIGAHDDISKGQSTFMVEMNETADILNNLSQRSLVILDEIGRGTSTYDGLSLAWALAEHLQTTKARTLFATHFHELTSLADQYPGVKNYNVAVKEWKDEIIFLHKIVPGGTDDSYGIYVAKLAGIPGEVINRSKKILTQLELKTNLKENMQNRISGENQLTLFSKTEDPIMEEIKSIITSMDINSLTPLGALNKIQEMKKRLEENQLADEG